LNYTEIYNRIIERARSENRRKGVGLYYEAHHIIPKCMGGDGALHQWRFHPNLVLLTAREHFVAHRLLCEIYPENIKLKLALWAMCNQNTYGSRIKITGRVYEYLKQESSKIKSKLYKGKPGTWIGKSHSLESKTKMSESAKGRKASVETKKKMSISRQGKTHSSISKQKMAEAALGKSKPKFECMYCGKIIGGQSNINRHENTHK
jgi:hypothetical protein